MIFAEIELRFLLAGVTKLNTGKKLTMQVLTPGVLDRQTNRRFKSYGPAIDSEHQNQLFSGKDIDEKKLKKIISSA